METAEGRVNRVVAKRPELRCGAIKKDGMRCGMARLRGSTLCFYHDPRPEIMTARAKARGKGTSALRAVLRQEELPAFDLSTRSGSIHFREQLIRLVLTGRLNPRCAWAAAEIARRLPEDFEALVRYYQWNREPANDLALADLARLEEAWVDHAVGEARGEMTRELMENVRALDFPHPAANPGRDPLEILTPPSERD